MAIFYDRSMLYTIVIKLYLPKTVSVSSAVLVLRTEPDINQALAPVQQETNVKDTVNFLACYHFLWAH